MTCSRIQRHLFARATAWLLILVCAWMGTGGVLHHTEEESFGLLGAHSLVLPSAGSIHRTTIAAPPDMCAACEWTQGLLGGTVAVYHVQTPLLLLRPISLDLTPAPTRRVLRLRSPRAPPVFPADC
ncbi:MAG: hypothetical protein M3Y13_14185 [Armatimonadota bacterium]|nr:hypothetical protein [Armatimonadota bacterium]